MTFGSLFAGIGGLDLGLERVGMTCVWQVECDPYACRVLQKHWPDVRRHDDVCTFLGGTGGDIESWKCDLICGGFPCQDISFAGKGAGLVGQRSGLWYEFARIVGEIRPRYVLVENVTGLFVRGMDVVLGSLASLGYDAEWEVIPAASVGAPHLRERVFILAYPNGIGFQAYSDENILCRTSAKIRDAGLPCHVGGSSIWSQTRPIGARSMGVDNGIPSDLDRIKCLGNAVVPQVAEWIGNRIMEFESMGVNGGR